MWLKNFLKIKDNPLPTITDKNLKKYLLKIQNFRFKDQIKIVHFCGKLKPWFVTFNTQTKNAEIPSDYAHASDIIQMWWSIFCENVHDNLSEQMVSFLVHLIAKQQRVFEFFFLIFLYLINEKFNIFAVLI